MELQIISFPSGIRMVFCKDTENYVVTDVATETMRAEFIYLGKDDSIDNYKAIDKNISVPIPDNVVIEENKEEETEE